MYAMLKQLHGATTGNNMNDLKLLIQNKYHLIPTLKGDKIIEGSNIVAHRKTDEDTSLV